MGLFSRKPRIDPPELLALREELLELVHRLDAGERSRAELAAQLQQLDDATTALVARSNMIDDVTLRLAEVDVLRARVESLDGIEGPLAELTERVTATTDEAHQAKDQMAALDERISNVSTELANQLGELSIDIDALAKSQAHAAEKVVGEQPVSAEVIEQLHTAQVRLANEQARYEIAFRQDLAALADQLKRARNAP